MRTLEQLREAFIAGEIQPTAWLGDSPQRFDTYCRYAQQVDSIVEFGVYTGLSTCAWLMGKPKKLRSYDITSKNFAVLQNLEANAIVNGIDFKFQIANSLQLDIEPCDLLFIDTVHKFDHCLQELNRHGKSSSRFIILHDSSDWPGVFQAAINYLHHNRQWHIIEHCNRNSGLLVLERYHD